MSKGLLRLIKLKGWQDSYRSLNPNTETFSRYYGNSRGEGATRIDRNYHFGCVTIKEVKYLPLAFSDHFGLIVKILLPGTMQRLISPKARPSFKLKPEVIRDQLFKNRLEESMKSWLRIRNFQGQNIEKVDTLV